MPKFGTKNALFGCFWARILKNYFHIWNQPLQICLLAKFWEKNIVIFEISTLEFAKNESLTHTVTFGIGLVFSESPGPGLGPLYKVYLALMFRNSPLPPYNLEYH